MTAATENGPGRTTCRKGAARPTAALCDVAQMD
jgi:hypothetical protein